MSEAPTQEASLLVHEIYLSIQGESTYVGLPCIFIRLTGCDLRCSYCDTAYAFKGGKRMNVSLVLEEVNAMAERFARDPAHDGCRLPLVEITGGEPMLQRSTPALMAQLCDAGYRVLLETSGAHDVSSVDERVIRIVDLKCPSSGESERMVWENLDHLRGKDELKMVIATHEDYRWCREQIRDRKLAELCPILVSWCAPLSEGQQDEALKPGPSPQELISRKELVEQLVHDALPVRFQAQLHKIIWPADQKGV